MWPKGHDRRNELVAEFYEVPVQGRLLWVVEQLESGLFDGLPKRAAARRARRRERRTLGPEEYAAYERKAVARLTICMVAMFGIIAVDFLQDKTDSAIWRDPTTVPMVPMLFVVYLMFLVPFLKRVRRQKKNAASKNR
jgi:hypothetical protein